ncbi:MAG: hypothetical protein R6U51_04905, partial [Anaerolineales bacterium]
MCVYVVGIGDSIVCSAQELKEVLLFKSLTRPARRIEGAVGPGIGAGQQGSCPGRGEITCRIVVVVDSRVLREPGQIWRRLTLVSIKRQMTRGE